MTVAQGRPGRRGRPGLRRAAARRCARSRSATRWSGSTSTRTGSTGCAGPTASSTTSPTPTSRAALDTGRYTPTDDAADLAGFDTAVVCVPTPLRDGAPDLRFIEDAARLLAPHLRRGACVVLESTTYPGTTEEVFGPILEAGLGAARRRGLPPRLQPRAHRPEQPDVGAAEHAEDRLRGRRGLGGRGRGLLRRPSSTGPCRRPAPARPSWRSCWRTPSGTSTSRWSTSWPIYCHELGIDVWSVDRHGRDEAVRVHAVHPGPGVGGHCLPIDPSYLSWQVRRALGRTFRFVEIANDVNDNMPGYVVSRVVEHLNRRRRAVNGSRVLLVGLTYKRNSGDARQSPATAVARRLADLGAELSAVDPLIAAGRGPRGRRAGRVHARGRRGGRRRGRPRRPRRDRLGAARAARRPRPRHPQPAHGARASTGCDRRGAAVPDRTAPPRPRRARGATRRPAGR